MRTPPGIDAQRFEQLRDTLAITARRMTKEQVHELVDHLYCTLRRRQELSSWDAARRGGAFGFD